MGELLTKEERKAIVALTKALRAIPPSLRLVLDQGTENLRAMREREGKDPESWEMVASFPGRIVSHA